MINFNDLQNNLDSPYFNYKCGIFENSETHLKYSIDDIYNVFLKNTISIIKHQKVEYIDCICSFDIETSSFYLNDEKCSNMYIWQFGINGICIVGRTWSDFISLTNKLSNIFELNENKRIIVGVHNLSYEFQFIRKHFSWYKIFAIENRMPVYAITNNGIEFRCTYILSGYSLNILAKNLYTYKIEKLKSLDYDKIRHSQTPLTNEEISYCLNDIKIVMIYIYEQSNQYGNIAKIPLTKTSKVRNIVKNNCFYHNMKRKNNIQSLKYHEIVQSLKITCKEEYQQLKRAFSGGFTHANPFFRWRINIRS